MHAQRHNESQHQPDCHYSQSGGFAGWALYSGRRPELRDLGLAGYRQIRLSNRIISRIDHYEIDDSSFCPCCDDGSTTHNRDAQ